MQPKKKTGWKDVKIGLFVAIGFALVTIVIILKGGGKIDLFKEKIQYTTFFPEANGLKAGSEVWLAGVEIGEVQAVRFADVDGPEAIMVVLKVDADVRRRIRMDTVASLRTIGLLGDKYVELKPGTLKSPVVPPGGLVKGISLSTFDEVIGVGRTTAQGVNELLAELQILISSINSRKGTAGMLVNDPEMYRNLTTVIQRITKLMDTAENGSGTLGQLMSNPVLYNSMLETSAHARRTAASADSVLHSTNRFLAQLQNPENTVGKLTTDAALYTQMQTTLSRLDSLLQKVERGEGSLGRLTQQETTVQEMEGVLLDLRTLIQDVKQNPKKYIKVSVF